MSSQAIQLGIGVVRRFALILGVFLSIPVVMDAVAGSEDDYLSAISAEVEKVDKKTADAVKEEKILESLGGGPSQQEFEENLKERYLGSYTFYRKLSPRSQEEIYKDYQGGASIRDIRKKIMDRFLRR